MKHYLFLAALAVAICACQPEKAQENTVATTTASDTVLAPAPSAGTTDAASSLRHGTFVFAEQEPGESHRLVIPGDDSREMPTYYGSESNSGEGIYFYANAISDMQIDAAGNLSFTIGERKLYAEPVADINKKPLSDSGFSRDELHYKGRFAADGIELTCHSESGLCWEEKMLFKRQ